jgi:cell wall-associated NlpC family hydrolase
MLEKISAYMDRTAGAFNREGDGDVEAPPWQPEQSRPGSARCETDPVLAPQEKRRAMITGGALSPARTREADKGTGKRLADAAMKFVGRSKADMNGMDCSAFVKMAAKMAGVPLQKLAESGKGPNGCSRLATSLPKVPDGEGRTGDMVFFKIDKDPSKIASHVGILIVNDDGSRQILHMTNAGVRLNGFQDKAVRGGQQTWGDKVVSGGFGRIQG